MDVQPSPLQPIQLNFQSVAPVDSQFRSNVEQQRLSNPLPVMSEPISLVSESEQSHQLNRDSQPGPENHNSKKGSTSVNVTMRYNKLLFIYYVVYTRYCTYTQFPTLLVLRLLFYVLRAPSQKSWCSWIDITTREYMYHESSEQDHYPGTTEIWYWETWISAAFSSDWKTTW